MRPHHQIHRRGDQHRLVGGEQSRRREIVGEPRRHPRDQIGGRRRDDDEIGLARQADMAHLALVGQRQEVVIDLVLAERGDRERRHELLRRRGHDAAHRGAALAQPADQVEALIGGDPAGDDQQNAPALKQVGPPILSAEVNMLLPEGKGDELSLPARVTARRRSPAKASAVIHTGRPRATAQTPRRTIAARTADGLGVQVTSPSRDHVGDSASRLRTSRGSALEQLGDVSGSGIGEPRLGAAIVAHPVLDQRPRQSPDVDARDRAAARRPRPPPWSSAAAGAAAGSPSRTAR